VRPRPANESYDAYLLQLTELESGVPGRPTPWPASDPRTTGFPRDQDFEPPSTSRPRPNLPKQKILELTRGKWIDPALSNCLPDRRQRYREAATPRSPWDGPLCQIGKRVKFLHRREAGQPFLEVAQQTAQPLDRVLAGSRTPSICWRG